MGACVLFACETTQVPEESGETAPPAAVTTAALEAGLAALLPDVSLGENTEYNGIILPEVWPPKDVDTQNDRVLTPPYLLSAEEGGYLPEVINITTGRQLFVDDFLIAETNLERVFHRPEKSALNPIFFPETAVELRSTDPGAAPISGGIWYDMEEKLWKMWYEAGWNHRLAYATSQDGIHWDRPAVQSNGGNLVLTNAQVDSTTVYLNYNAENPDERYLLFLRAPGGAETGASLYTSADGLRWQLKGRTANLGDRSTIFYNPFREKWVYSIRRSTKVRYGASVLSQRTRYYAECDDLLKGADFSENQVFWLKTDYGDKREQGSLIAPQLYNFDAVGYESIMVGMFQIWYGPENDICKTGRFPKTTELQAAYSRDGFHFDRPDRTAFIAATRTEGSWDRGYVQSVGGGLVYDDDTMYFYYAGFAGEYEIVPGYTVKGMHVGSSVGLATMRRDGFASMEGSGELLTNTLTIEGAYPTLYVNATGRVSAEILAPDGTVLPGYSFNDCTPAEGDSTMQAITFAGGDLSTLDGQAFRIRFRVESGALYSFWLSDDSGDSRGATAAGYVAEGFAG